MEENEKMFNTLLDRENFITSMLEFIKSKYDLVNTQIFIFGSFLTEEFKPGESDIDIGIYSEDEVKMYDIKVDLEVYLDKFDIKYDIVIMHLSKHLWINVPILLYGKQLTSYQDSKLIDYLMEMIEEWGYSPAEK